MLIRKPSDIVPSEITAERVYLRRRTLLASVLAATPALVVGCGGDDARAKQAAASTTPATPPADAPPATFANLKASAYSTTEQRTGYRELSTYNNFYEFGTGKADPARNAHTLKPKPWSVTVSGHCEEKGTFALEDLVPTNVLEERIYRMRCVEGWSMVIPWVGFPLADLLKRFKPTSQAKYVAFRTLLDPAQMPGQREAILDWPYDEGLRIDEAMHPLALMAVGVYGRELPNQNGAPLRLVVPWKYGFKGIKSITEIEFTESEPPTAWNKANDGEYGFYSNVNPDVRHPRWSQASERRLTEGSGLYAERIPTRLFNGYDNVASLYAGMDLKKLY